MYPWSFLAIKNQSHCKSSICSSHICPLSPWHLCKFDFGNFLGIITCRALLSSLDGVICLYRTPLYSTNSLHCLKYCFIICGPCKYTLNPLSLMLLIRYLISYIAGSSFLALSNSLATWLLDTAAYLRSQWPVYCRSKPLLRGDLVLLVRTVHRPSQSQYAVHGPPLIVHVYDKSIT